MSLVTVVVSILVSDRLFKKNTPQHRKYLLIAYMSSIGLTLFVALLNTKTFPAYQHGQEFCTIDKEVLQDRAAFLRHFPASSAPFKDYLDMCLFSETDSHSTHNMQSVYTDYVQMNAHLNTIKTNGEGALASEATAAKGRIQETKELLPQYQDMKKYSDAVSSSQGKDRDPFVVLGNMVLWADSTHNYYTVCKDIKDQFVYDSANCTYPVWVSDAATPLLQPTCLNALTMTLA